MSVGFDWTQTEEQVSGKAGAKFCKEFKLCKGECQLNLGKKLRHHCLGDFSELSLFELDDVSQFNEIYSWLRGHNPTFSVMPEISNCPSPLIIEDDSSSDDEPKNPNLESQVEIQYWFPNNGNPTGPNSVFSNSIG